MKKENPVKTYRPKLVSRVIYFDLFGFLTSTFFFLYFNPSSEKNMELTYIGLQLLICTVCVFAFRCVFRIYKRINDNQNPKFHLLNLKLYISDFCAGIVIYIIQLLLPNTGSPTVRISFIQTAIIVGFNLLIGSFSRSVFQCVYDWLDSVNKEWTEA